MSFWETLWIMIQAAVLTLLAVAALVAIVVFVSEL
jgi:hypothetical protein